MPKTVTSDSPDNRLSFLVEKIVTSGNFDPDVKHFRELCELLCNDVSLVQQCMRLLSIQLKREHAQIRLGVMNLLFNLSMPSFVVEHTSFAPGCNSILNLCSSIRNTLLGQLQSWACRILSTDVNEAPLPPPFDAACRAVKGFINLLLDWEADIEQGTFEVRKNAINRGADTSLFSWKCTSLARGQLKSFMTYMRSTAHSCHFQSSKKHVETFRLRDLLAAVEGERNREQAAMTAETKALSRRVRRCLVLIKEFEDRIEENLVTLESLLKLLVPDPFASSVRSDQVEHFDHRSSPSHLNSQITSSLSHSDDADNRVHGRLCGSSSGLNPSTSSVDIHLPCTPGSTDLVCISIERTDDVRVLESSARESAILARDKHKPLLTDWLVTLNIGDLRHLEPSLRRRSNAQVDRIRQWLSRLERFTHLFFDRLIFVDSLDTGSGNKVSAANTPTMDSSDSSNESDFEEVLPDANSKLPEVSTEPSCSSTSAATICEIVPSTTASISSGTKPYISGLSTSMDNSVVFKRETDSLHRFWRPIEPEEYQTPEDYIALALNSSASNQVPDVPPTSSDCEPVNLAALEPEIGSAPEPTVACKLACWAPLPSGRLCPRRDLNNRCSIHGLIVKRDPINGRPVNPEDREMLYNELLAARQDKEKAQADAAKRLARRRYPGLVDLRRPVSTPRKRLRTRVLNKRALEEAAKALDSHDQLLIAARFSDNFVHVVRPK